MLYTRAHVRSLEAQIARLEQTYLEQLQRLAETYSAQIAELKQSLAAERKERKQLLDRLLAKANIEPVADKPPPKVEAVPIISPFGSSATPEMFEAYKESWISEEAVYLQAEQGMSEQQAQATAEKKFIAQHRPVE